MADKIFSKDIFGEDLTKKPIKEIEALIKVFEKLEQQQKEHLKLSAEGLKINAKEYDDVKRNTKAIQDFEKAEQALLKTEQERVKLEKQAQDLINKKITTEQKELALSQKKIKMANDNAKATLGLNNAYTKQSRKLNDLRKEYKHLIISQGKETKATKKMRKEIQRLDKQLKDVDASAGQFQRSVGNYGKALGGLRNLASAALPVAGVAGVVSVVGNAVKVFRDFEKANSNLKAVLGNQGTDEAMASLAETAKDLGAKTAFTATQVSGLQTEFAKLGFSVQEIQNATGATLDLAAASGTELADAAAIAGATLGGFQLGAEETQRVVDVMAKSFSVSALDMEKFKESMKDAAPAAAAVGISVEETTALLGTMANAGISGSKAGTALKSSLINLNKAGLTLNQAFEKVNKSTDKLGTATKLVGKNAAASFLVMAEGTKTTKELTDQLIDAEGAAQKMAEVQLDNLEGDITKLGSAWEGFILKLESGNGVLAKSLRNIVQFLNKVLEGLSLASMSLDEIRDKNKDEATRRQEAQQRKDDIKEFYGFISRIENISEEEFKKLSKDRQKDLADRFLRITRETLNRLNAEGKDANDEYYRFTENTIKNIEKLAGIGVKSIKNIAIGDGNGGNSENILTRLEELQKKLSELKKKRLGLADENGILDPKKLKEANDEIAETEIKIQNLLDNLNGIKKKAVKTSDNNADSGGLYNNETAEAMCKNAGGTWDRDKQFCEFPETEEGVKNFTEYASLITEIVERETQKRIDAIDKEIEANERRQEVLSKLAAQGNQDAENNLANERKRQAELEREREKAIKREQRIKLALAALTAYTQNAENDPNTALGKTIADTNLLMQAIREIPTFYEGTEDTGNGGKLDSKGGFNAILHPNERVMTADQNKHLTGISNWELSNLGKSYKEGKLNTVVKVDNTEVVNKLDEIASKPTYMGRDYDATERAIIDKIESRGRVERNHRRNSSKLF